MAYCEACKGNMITTPPIATKRAAQSYDQGKTVTYMNVCAGHYEGWWDGADWDGSHLDTDI